MANLVRLSPEVAGGWGPETVVANQDAINSGTARVSVITDLEYMFDGWLGDALLTSFPVYLVTDELARDLTREELSGIQLEAVKISTSEEFDELQSDTKLPQFRRLMPQGKVKLTGNNRIKSWSGHDMCLNEQADLIVTERCLNILRRHGIDNCEVEYLLETK
jgi:hypothetical protein